MRREGPDVVEARGWDGRAGSSCLRNCGDSDSRASGGVQHFVVMADWVVQVRLSAAAVSDAFQSDRDGDP